MAHVEWCGKPCCDCETSCQLHESISCPPDCKNLRADGTHNLLECENAGCDVSAFNYCHWCGTDIAWGNRDEQHGTVWVCGKCGFSFCEECFKAQHGAEALHNMIGMDGKDDNILCPNCYEKRKGTKLMDKNFASQKRMAALCNNALDVIATLVMRDGV